MRTGQKTDSPRTKTRKLLRYATRNDVRKTLEFHHTLIQEIKAKYRATTVEREKQVFCRLFTGRIIKRCKYQKLCQSVLGMSRKRYRQDVTNVDPFIGKEYMSISRRLQRCVDDFFNRDDVSRITTGVKQTITRGKIKEQKRLLCDTLKHIYVKYLVENATVKVSYVVFCRLRPFYVVMPTDKDRDTCLCKIHKNIQYLATKLKDLQLVKTDNLDELVESVSCNTADRVCMYGECRRSEEHLITMDIPDENVQTSWYAWKTIREDRQIKKQGNTELKEVTLTIKEEVFGTVSDLTDKFQDHLIRFKKHHFNIRHQDVFYRNLKRGMHPNEALLHIDFAENYNGKRNSECSFWSIKEPDNITHWCYVCWFQWQAAELLFRFRFTGTWPGSYMGPP